MAGTKQVALLARAIFRPHLKHIYVYTNKKEGCMYAPPSCRLTKLALNFFDSQFAICDLKIFPVFIS